jgi:putative glutamine amidotransferase
MKKTIGISFTTTNLSYYWSWFTPRDLDQITLVDLSFQKNNEADFDGCDGFILTGGVDIQPSLYRHSEHYTNRPSAFQEERDYFEEKIFRHSQENKKPLLGICRGLQLVNVLQGGRLIQDLGDIDNTVHRAEDGWDREHAVTIEENSLLYEINGSASAVVNSAHHQVADPDAIGENLMVNAHSDDSTKRIEGLEFTDKAGKAFMLCVQWHPERMLHPENNLSEKIKSKFIDAVLYP